MKTIKKLFGIAAVILFPCFVRSETAAEPMVLEFWDFPHLPETNRYLEKAIGDFETENPGMKIRYTRLPWQDGQQKVTLAVLGGSPPDVCGQVSNNISQFVAQDVLEPLDEYIAPELADFHKSYIENVSFDGKIYAIPWYKTGYVMLLNLDVFEAFGVEPPQDGRWTYDEFVEKMKKMTGKHDPPNMHPEGPLTLSGKPKLDYLGLVTNLGPAEYEAYSIIYNWGGRVLKETPSGDIRAAVGDRDFITGLEKLQDLDWKHNIVAPSIGAFTQEQSWGLWRDSRTVACTIQGAWCINAVEQANRDLLRINEDRKKAGREHEMTRPFRYAIAAPPTSDMETTPVLGSSGLGTFVVFKQKEEKRREMAAKFAAYLVRGEGQTVLKYECVYPSRISAGNPYADNPGIGPVFELFPSAVVSPLIPGGERIDRVLQQEIQQALLRNTSTGKPQLTAEQAAKAGQTKVEAVLERAKRRFGSLH